MNVYFVSNLGLGDNINFIGAVNYISQFYNTVFVITKSCNKKNMKLLYQSNLKVKICDIEYNLIDSMNKIIDAARLDPNTDIIAPGPVHNYCCKITNQEFIDHKAQLTYSNTYDDLFSYCHIHLINICYNTIGLNLSIYVDYFNIDETYESIKLYESIQDYKIIFTHTQSSSKKIHFDLTEYDSDEYIIINPNENYYNNNNNNNNNNNKSVLAQQFVDIPLINYISVILHSHKIFIVDSCFSSMILPMCLTYLKDTPVVIKTR